MPGDFAFKTFIYPFKREKGALMLKLQKYPFPKVQDPVGDLLGLDLVFGFFTERNFWKIGNMFC